MKILKKEETTDRLMTEEREACHELVFENFHSSVFLSSILTDYLTDLKSDRLLMKPVVCFVCDGSRRPHKNLHICSLCFVSTDNNNNGDDNARQHDDATRGERVSASMVL